VQRHFLICLCAALMLLGSCRRDNQIQTYRVSKESDNAMPAAGAMSTDAPPSSGGPFGEAPGASAPEGNAAAPEAPAGDTTAMGNQIGMTPAASPQDVSWTAPSGWTPQPPSAMRVGSFLIQGADGQQAEVSVVPLSGDAGGDLANINRWRGQLNLEPITQEQLAQVSRQKSFAGRSMLWVEFPSREKLINNQFKRRLIAAIYQQGERSWFFKMMGEDATVRAAAPAFEKFLKSLRFRNS
jgi:hypothetical protein